MNKGLPFTLTGSKVTDLAGKSPSTGRVGYQLDGDNHFLIGNGTPSPYEYPTVNKTIKLINDAIAASGGGTSTGTLVTTPVITGAASVAANTNVTLSASGSHSALEDDTRVTVKYVWTKPDNSVAEGSSVTVSSTTAGGTVTVKCKAVDSLGNASAISTFVITTISAVNNPPTAPAVVSDFPATIVRSSSYTLKFASTDQDGDAVTFSIVGLIGCTASVMSGITAATGTVVTIDSQADSVSVSIKAVDSKGAQSTSALVLSKTGSSITNPTGTTGYLTAGQTHIVNIPDWADTATLTGNGSAGTAACQNGQYHIGKYHNAWNLTGNGGVVEFNSSTGSLLPALFYDSDGDVASTTDKNGCWRLAQALNASKTTSYTDTTGSGQLSSSNFTAMGVCAPSNANTDGTLTNYGTAYVTPQVITHKTLGSLYPTALQYAAAASTTAGGESTTITGAVTSMFAGAASGVTITPTQTTQIKTLPVGTSRTITVYIPVGGTFKADWS